MILSIPIFSAVRFMVYDESNVALRGFYSKPQAQTFIGSDKDLTIKQLPQKFKTYEVEEAPF